MKYQGILPRKKPWVKATVIFLAVYMLLLETLAGQYLYVPIAILVILSCFFQKEHLLTREGADIQHTLFGWTTHHLWRWEEIQVLYTDRRKAAPNVTLHIGKDVSFRTFLLTPADCQWVLRLAAAQNPNIHVEDLSKKEQEHRGRNPLSTRKKRRKASPFRS